MNIEQIKEECRQIIALAESEHLTKGPWIARKMDLGDVYSADHTWIYSEPMDASIAAVRRGCGEVGAEKENAADAAFIAASRSFTPKAAQAVLETIDVLQRIVKTKFGWEGDCGVVAIAENGLETIRHAWEGLK